MRLRESVAMRDSYFLEQGTALPGDAERALFDLLFAEVKHYYLLDRLRIAADGLQREFDALATNGVIHFKDVEAYLRGCGRTLTRDKIVAFFRAVTEDLKLTYKDFCLATQRFQPEQIALDKQRAYYSTPKKYRRDQTLSPISRVSSTRKTAATAAAAPPVYAYVTPTKADEQDKQTLLSQSDFNIGQLYYKSLSIKSTKIIFFTCPGRLLVHAVLLEGAALEPTRTRPASRVQPENTSAHDQGAPEMKCA